MKQGRRPKLSCRFDRGNLQVGPPRHFVALAMQLMMVVAAERHGEFVANLASQGSRLREFQVMGIAWRALADQAGLRADECEVGLVAVSRRPAQRGHLFFGVWPLVFGDRGSGRLGGITNRSIRCTDRCSFGCSAWTLLKLICIEIQSAEHDLPGGLNSACIVGSERILSRQPPVRP